MKKPTVKRIIVLSIIAFAVIFEVFDIFVFPPAWWRFDRQRDKRAILAYVKNTYPSYIKRKGSKFPLQLPAGPFEDSVMFFELDGIEFHVGAQDGHVTEDGYSLAKAEAQFDRIIQDGFLKPRKIKASSVYWFIDDYDIYPYTGGLEVTLAVFDQGSTPERDRVAL